MAVSAWQRHLSLVGTVPSSDAHSRLIPAGIFFSVSNPYWWIWWALLVSLYIRDALTWGAWGVLALFVVHWLTDVGWLTGLSWLSGSGHKLISENVYRWIVLFCGGALIFFGISFIVAGVTFVVTGSLQLG